MALDMKHQTAQEFLSLIETNSLIEERIQLMIGDPAIKSILFQNGQLYYRLKEGGFRKLSTWKLTFEETIQFMLNFLEKIEVPVSNETEIDILFKEHVVFYENVENVDYKDLNERLIHSKFKINIVSLENVVIPDIQEDDLPF